MSEIKVTSYPTPNPHALKFILNVTLKNEGKSTYKDAIQCGENKLARSLFTIKGVKSLHFFQNTVTVTKDEQSDWEILSPYLEQSLLMLSPNHDPNYNDIDEEAERRKNLTPELQNIEKILDETIRPSLQFDGGDITCVELKDNILFVRYQGACGSCPSSTTGTLEAIKNILQQKLENQELEVYPIVDQDIH